MPGRDAIGVFGIGMEEDPRALGGRRRDAHHEKPRSLVVFEQIRLGLFGRQDGRPSHDEDARANSALP